MPAHCFVCRRSAGDAAGELWFRHLDANGGVVATTCNSQDDRHARVNSDLRRPIQGELQVVLLEAFLPERG